MVHPKNVVIIYSPSVVPNLYEFLSSVEHKRTYFKKCW